MAAGSPDDEGTPVRFIYHPPAPPAAFRVIYMYEREGYEVGTLVWHVCDGCRLGYITKISSPRSGSGRA